MRDSVLKAYKDFTVKFEGYTPFMYLDVKKLVTTGIGNLIDSHQAALALPWRKRSTGALATPGEVIAAWDKVKSRTDLAPRGGFAFQNLTDLYLDNAGIEKLVIDKLKQNEATLKKRFPGFEAWPADGQLAVLSMAWALGPNFNYPKLTSALNQLLPDFAAAAAEAKISEVGNPGVKPRNEANKALFENAARAVKYGYDLERLYWPNILDEVAQAAKSGVPFIVGGAIGLGVVGYVLWKS